MLFLALQKPKRRLRIAEPPDCPCAGKPCERDPLGQQRGPQPQPAWHRGGDTQEPAACGSPARVRGEGKANDAVEIVLMRHLSQREPYTYIGGAQGSEEGKATEKVVIRNGWDFRWEIAHAAVSPHPPEMISLYTIESPYSHVHVRRESLGSLSIVQGPFSVVP
jgi:hypothetical protein